MNYFGPIRPNILWLAGGSILKVQSVFTEARMQENEKILSEFTRELWGALFYNLAILMGIAAFVVSMVLR